MDVHPAELALEPLPAVPLHDLTADVARGDVLECVLSKLVMGLKDRGRLHLHRKNIQVQKKSKRPETDNNLKPDPTLTSTTHRLDNQ